MNEDKLILIIDKFANILNEDEKYQNTFWTFVFEKKHRCMVGSKMAGVKLWGVTNEKTNSGPKTEEKQWLTHLRVMLSSYGNQSIDLLCKYITGFYMMGTLTLDNLKY